MTNEELSAEPTELVVPLEHEGTRLDSFLAQQFTRYSRVLLRKVINAAGVKVNGERVKAAHRLRAGERVTIAMPELAKEGPVPENIPLEILYEDAHLAVINKPSGMVVHPGKGHWAGTLAAALQFHFNELSTTAGPARPGIVHRLDRDTTGVLLVAKTDQAHMHLASQFEHRQVEKEYFAVCAGVPNLDRDLIDLPIAPHAHHREKMAIRPDHPLSRSAQSFYEVLERFHGFAALRILPKTGRTHQIRLHLTAIDCAVLCDRLYGGRAQITRGDLLRGIPDDDVLLDRQALHARRLKIHHPETNQPMEFEAPIPADIEFMLGALRELRPAR